MADEAQIEAIDKGQADIERTVLLAALAAFAVISNRIDIARVSEQIGRGDVSTVLAEIGLGGEAESAVFRDVATAARKSTVKAGDALAALFPVKQLPSPPGSLVPIQPVVTAVPTPLRFSTINPAYIDFETRREARIMLELMTTTRDGAQVSLLEGLRNATRPEVIARQLRGRIGLDARSMTALANFERGLADQAVENEPATALRAREVQNRRLVRLYQQRLLQTRALRIARTEGTMAVNAANQFVWEQAVVEGRIDPNNIRRFWVTVGDLRVRDAHVSTPGLNPDGRFVDEPFVTPLGPMFFPGDPGGLPRNRINCRCRLVISALDL